MRISRHNRELHARIELPASKSISNRLLILRFLYGPGLKINNLSRSDDTLLLSSILEVIARYKMSGERSLLRIDSHNAGTVFRFLTALLAITRGQYILTGSSRMRSRPVGPLVDALRMIGADIEYPENVGFPPLLIKGHNLEGGRLNLDPSLSSQYLSALLLVAPFMEIGLTIDMTGRAVSWPYVEMTSRLLTELKVKVMMEENSIRVQHSDAVNSEMTVERDWSSSAFWYSMLSMADKGEVRFPGLKPDSIQGDRKVATIFRQFGIVTEEEDEGIRIYREVPEYHSLGIDFSGCPDLALPVILSGAVAGMENEYIGLERLKIKESDRLAVMAREMAKIGISLVQPSPAIWQTTGDFTRPAEFYLDHDDDHRVAMAFAALAMKGSEVNINGPEVVNKSYPEFWKHMALAGFDVET